MQNNPKKEIWIFFMDTKHDHIWNWKKQTENNQEN